MAPVYSDIIWDNMMNDQITHEFKSWILVAILFIVCVVLITPTVLIDHLHNVILYFDTEFGKGNLLSLGLQTFAAPLLILAFNSGILPLFIDFIAFLEGHPTKSKRQLGIMKKNFFFQIFNIIFL